MPNWTEQELHVVGPKREIDRFIRVGFTRRHRDEVDELLHFCRLCPSRHSDPKNKRVHESGVVLHYFRTRTQASFSIITASDYPAAFYACLIECWPSLAFVCSVNGEMGNFGGIVMALRGEALDLVQDYDRNYDRRVHKRSIRELLHVWMDSLTRDRPFLAMPGDGWSLGSMPFDAHFDEDFWFYFRTRQEAAAFTARYKSASTAGEKRRGNGGKRGQGRQHAR